MYVNVMHIFFANMEKLLEILYENYMIECHEKATKFVGLNRKAIVLDIAHALYFS